MNPSRFFESVHEKQGRSVTKYNRRLSVAIIKATVRPSVQTG